MNSAFEEKIRFTNREKNDLIRDWLFIFIFRFKQSAYCTDTILVLFINTLKSVCVYVCNNSVDKLALLLKKKLLLSKAFKI